METAKTVTTVTTVENLSTQEHLKQDQLEYCCKNSDKNNFFDVSAITFIKLICSRQGEEQLQE